MNIFGIGGAELVLIFIIMLIVAGPKRMLRWAYVLGQLAGKVRDIWQEVMAVVQAEIDQAGMDIDLPREMPTRQNINRWARDQLDPYTKSLEDAVNETRDTMTRGSDQIQAGVEDAQQTIDGVDKPDDTQTRTNLGSWGGADQTPAAPKFQRRANPNAVSQGSGAVSSAESAFAADVSPTPNGDHQAAADRSTGTDNRYGAWSKPQHPGSETAQQEQEA